MIGNDDWHSGQPGAQGPEEVAPIVIGYHRVRLCAPQVARQRPRNFHLVDQAACLVPRQDIGIVCMVVGIGVAVHENRTRLMATSRKPLSDHVGHTLRAPRRSLRMNLYDFQR